MTSPLSPEAVAQMVADLSYTDGLDGEMSMLYRCEIADALTTLAAENATLRASEAAALERADKLAGALEHMQWCRTCAEGSWKDCDDGLAALDMIEPLTPTADKE